MILLFRDLNDRQKLDRRRFEAAHFKYAVLTVFKRYPSLLDGKKPSLYTNMTQTLDEITPLYFKSFQDCYTSMVNIAHFCIKFLLL